LPFSRFFSSIPHLRPHIPSFPSRRSSDLSHLAPFHVARRRQQLVALGASRLRAGRCRERQDEHERGDVSHRNLQDGCVWRDSKRSEEHTSELQSPDHLVCRLLLEKKKYKY